MDGIKLIRDQRGLPAKLARELEITPGAIYQWKEVPAERLLDVERITGIPREKLRPDLYRGDAA
jgi:DNA-binding transcriptional regulator YdaS (Cro superfamily)